MQSAPISVVVRIAAAVASIATTLTLLSAVVALSEPQQSQLVAATASRQITPAKTVVVAAQSKQARPGLVPEVSAR